jgi:hypothetical protein
MKPAASQFSVLSPFWQYYCSGGSRLFAGLEPDIPERLPDFA